MKINQEKKRGMKNMDKLGMKDSKNNRSKRKKLREEKAKMIFQSELTAQTHTLLC